VGQEEEKKSIAGIDCSAKNLAVSPRSSSSSTTGLLSIITTSSFAGRSVAIERIKSNFKVSYFPKSNLHP
jgi:hypothetical protein